MIDCPRFEPLIRLEKYSGTFACKSLSLDITSIGVNCGFLFKWQWHTGTVDHGLLGADRPSRLVLALISTTHPRFDGASMQYYVLRTNSLSNEELKLSFFNSDMTKEEIHLAFLDDLRLHYTFVVNPKLQFHLTLTKQL